VNSTEATQKAVSVVYVGYDHAEHKTLYASRLNFSQKGATFDPADPATFRAGAPAVVVQKGDEIVGMNDGVVRDIGIYDPVNNHGRGDLVFWVDTDEGQGIIHTQVPVRYLNQGDNPWYDDWYASGLSADTGVPRDEQGHPFWIKYQGCALTTLTMALDDVAGLQETPGTLNALFQSPEGKGGYGGIIGNDVNWPTAVKLATGQAGITNVQFTEVHAPDNDTQVLDDLVSRRGLLTVVKVKNGGHFILVTGKVGNRFVIADPGHRTVSNADDTFRSYLDVYGDQFTIKGYISDPGEDLSETTFAASAPEDGLSLLVTDPQGRRTGYDPATGETLTQIPGTYARVSQVHRVNVSQ